jgi:hypothetical protein
LTDGYQLGFLIGAGLVVVAIGVAVMVLEHSSVVRGK